MSLLAVIPAYRASKTIISVIERALHFVDAVVVVDDACPEHSAEVVTAAFVSDPRVHVVRLPENRGVGGATKAGFAAALEAGAEIVVKLDSDDQMDASFIPYMVNLLRDHPYLSLVKGNRFGSSALLATMPIVRLVGNSGLSFLVKIASGYWNLIDPTNGYIAVRSEALRDLDLKRLADRYFFEIDLLCALGIRRAPIAELEMDPIYSGENSSLSIAKTLVSFPGPLFRRTVRRLFTQYVIADINVATLYAALGIPLFAIGAIFGLYQWHESHVTDLPRTSGTVVLALLFFIIGFQLMLQAVAYDVSEASRTLKVRISRGTLEKRSRNERQALVLDENSSLARN